MFLVSDLLSQGSNVVRHAVRGLADRVVVIRLTQSGIWLTVLPLSDSVRDLADGVAVIRLTQSGVWLTVLPLSDLLSQGSG